MTMTTFLEQVYGMEHVESQNRLSLRLELGKSDLAELTEALRTSPTLTTVEKLTLSVGLTYFHRRNPQVEEGVMEVCRAICENLPKLKELRIYRSQAGWQPLQVMAKFPVQAVEILLQKMMPQLTALEFTSLQFYSTDEASPLEVLLNALEQPYNDTDMDNDTVNPSKLQLFGWVYSDCTPRLNSIDPLLTTLSKMGANVKDVHLQTPSWASQTQGKSMEQFILGCPNLRHLCFKGLHLCPEQIQALSWAEQLQKLSLLCPLAIPTALPMGHAMAHVLQHSAKLEKCALSLRLQVNDTAAASRTVVPLDPPTIDTLQQVQDAIAQALHHNTCLKSLEVLYSNHSTPWQHPTHTQAFVDLLQHYQNTTLVQLHLPFCGELETPVAFYQQLNQSGLRRALLTDVQDDVRYFWKTLLNGCGSLDEKSQQQQQQQQQPVEEEQTKHTLHQLSMLYYFLREKPYMIPAAATPSADC